MTKSQFYDPNTSFGFVLQDVARLMREYLNHQIKPIGLTMDLCRALAHIKTNEGLSQSRLAEIMEMQPITISRLIDRMEAVDWIERRPDPVDRRAVQIYLRPNAVPIMEHIRESAAKLRAQSARDMNEKEKDMFFDLLKRMRVNLAEEN